MHVWEEDGRFSHFVHPVDWCVEWVGEHCDDDIIVGCDAHAVADLISYAKQYVYKMEKANVEA